MLSLTIVMLSLWKHDCATHAHSVIAFIVMLSLSKHARATHAADR